MRTRARIALAACVVLLPAVARSELFVTRDGKVFGERVVYPKGNPKNPVTSDELVAAFRGMATYSAKPLSSDKIDDAVSLVLRLEEVPDVSILIRLLTH